MMAKGSVVGQKKHGEGQQRERELEDQNLSFNNKAKLDADGLKWRFLM